MFTDLIKFATKFLKKYKKFGNKNIEIKIIPKK